MTTPDLKELREKWKAARDYALNGEFITDEHAGEALTVEAEAARDLIVAYEVREVVVTKAAGLVRTAYVPETGEVKVVRQWWDSLTNALAALAAERPPSGDDVEGRA